MITWKNILHRLYIVYVHRLDALILSPGFGLSPSAIAAEIDPAASGVNPLSGLSFDAVDTSQDGHNGNNRW